MRPVSRTSGRPAHSISTRWMSNMAFPFMRLRRNSSETGHGQDDEQLLQKSEKSGWRSCHGCLAIHFHTAAAPCRRADSITIFRQRRTETRMRPRHGLPRLATQAQPIDDLLVTRTVNLLEIVEKAAPLAHHLEQAPPGMIVLEVALEVLGQVGNPLGKDRDLDFRRTGVLDAVGVFLDQRLLAFGSYRHRIFLFGFVD